MISEDEVLKIQIDPSKITYDDIEKYENLMKGSISAGNSNATSQKGSINKNFVKHTWCLSDCNQPLIGPMELRLEKPSSLLSINIDISFKCIDIQNLTTSLQPNHQKSEIEEEKKTELTEQTLGQNASSQLSIKNYSLGQFSMKGFTEHSEAKKEVKSNAQYLPLAVKRNKGSCYNNNLMPSKMLIDNDNL